MLADPVWHLVQMPKEYPSWPTVHAPRAMCYANILVPDRMHIAACVHQWKIAIYVPMRASMVPLSAIHCQEFSHISLGPDSQLCMQEQCNSYYPVLRGHMGRWGPTAQKIFIGRWVGAMVGNSLHQ